LPALRWCAMLLEPQGGGEQVRRTTVEQLTCQGGRKC
jgi:hypothetical protein